MIITCYGEPILLRQAINSVVNQTYTNWELIVVDDNDPSSNERQLTDELLAEIKKTVSFKHVRHTSNMNGSVARNTGFRHSKGDYIAFLDSDDEYHPARLMVCVDTMKEAQKLYAGVYTGCTFRRKGREYAKRPTAPTGSFLIDSLACVFPFYSGSNIFVRRRVYEELCGFDESLLRHQDYDFLVRLFERYCLIGVERLLLLKNNDNYNLPEAEKMLKVKRCFLDKFSVILNDISDNDSSYIYYCHNIAMSELYASEGDFRNSQKYYIKSTSHQFNLFSLVKIVTKYLKFRFGVLS